MDFDGEHHKLVPVHSCGSDEEAEIIVEFLAANDIEAILDSNLPHSIVPVEDDAKVLVNEDDAEEAKRLLAERENMCDDCACDCDSDCDCCDGGGDDAETGEE